MPAPGAVVTRAPPSEHGTLVRVAALFAFSGAAALAFETLWFHQAALVFGSSALATSLVLGAFMAGLALGNALAAAFGDRLARPLRALAAIECGVGLGGALLVFGLPALSGALAPTLAALSEHPAVSSATRFAVAFALLALPATGMGLTLPVAARALAATPLRFGPVLGHLYGWNTLGAIAGVVWVEGVGVAALGLRGAALGAAGANAAAALLALGLSRREVGRTAPAVRPPPSPPLAGLPWLAATALAGFTLLALEVVGFRFLSLFVVGRAQAFAGMLAAVLLGIGAGGLLAEAWLRRRPYAAHHAATLALVCGVATILGYAAFPFSAQVLGLGPAKVEDPLWIAGACAALLLPVSLGSGALFTLCGAGLREALPTSGRAAGRLTVANTLGAAAGALAAPFLLLPVLGMEHAFAALAAVYGLIGCVLAGHAARGPLLAAAVALAAAAVAFPFGALRATHLPRALAAYDLPADARLLVREGPIQTAIWIEIPFLGAPYVQRLVTDGYSMSATDVQARRYMDLYAVLPSALHPGITQALLVSYGVGSTARALLDTPGLRALDVVDISREILALAPRAFRPPLRDPSRDPLRDPRTRIHVEDGRQFLLTTARRYDLITGEPPPPTLAGVVNLYTREYFALVRSRLASGGMFTTWLPLRELSDVAALSIVRAFCDAFPDCTLWRGMSFELMLLGTRDAAGGVSAEHFAARWHDPVARAELRAVGLERPEQLGALFIADAEALARFTAGVPPLVDDFPRRVTAPVTSEQARGALYADWLDPRADRARFLASDWIARELPPTLREGARAYFEVQHLLDTFGAGIRSDLWSERLGDLAAVLESSALRTPVLWLLGSDADAQQLVDAAPPEARARPEAQWHLAVRALAARDHAGAVAALARAGGAPETRERAVALHAFLLCLRGERGAADALLRAQAAALGPGPRVADLLGYLGETCGVGPAAR